MAAIDPQAPPHLDDKLLQQRLQRSEDIVHGPHESSTMTFKDPSGNIRTLNDKVMEKARSRFKKLVYRTMYPYGFDFTVMEPTTKIGEPATATPTGHGMPLHKLKGLKKALWRKAFKRAHERVAGRPFEGLKMPKRPKLKELLGRGLYATAGLGFAPHSAVDVGGTHGGAILGTIASLAAPLIIKGAQKLGSYVVKKVKERRARKKAAKEAAEEETTGSGKVPTEYQMKQAKQAADEAASKGLVGMPNPLSFPEYPPTGVPTDGLSVLRSVYDKTRRILHRIARDASIKPKRAVPFIEKFIKRHAKQTFGKGGARVIFNARSRAKPFGKHLTVAHLLYPIPKDGVPEWHDELIVPDHEPLHKPVKGNGIGDVLETLASLVLGENSLPWREIPSVFGALLPGVAQHIVGEAIEAVPSLLSNALGPLATFIETTLGLSPSFDMEQAMRDYGIINAGKAFGSGKPKYQRRMGRTITRGGGVAWDLIKGIGKLGLELGAPVLGALVSELLGKKHKAVGKAIKGATETLSESMGESRRASEAKQAQKEMIKEMEEEREKAIAAYKEARKITPEEFQQLRQESEYARMLAEMIKGLKAPQPESYHFNALEGMEDVMKRPYYGRRRSSKYSEDREPVEEDYSRYAPYRTMPAKPKKAKKKDKLAKLEKKLRKQKLKRQLMESAYSPDSESYAERKARKKAKKKEKKLRKHSLQEVIEEATMTKPETPEEVVEGSGFSDRTLTRTRGRALQVAEEMKKRPQPSRVLKLKPVQGVYYGMGPTTADAIRDRRRAMTVMTLSKKPVE